MALLAFNRIVASHPHLVAAHQDVILGCIDDPDISIRLQALQLGSGMINSDNLESVVNRLLRQLRAASSFPTVDQHDLSNSLIEPAADENGENPEEQLRPTATSLNEPVHMPDDYRAKIIGQIIEMCAKNTYENIMDFDWYIQTLTELARLVPQKVESVSSQMANSYLEEETVEDLSCSLGKELRNIAVRVTAVRKIAVEAAHSLLVTSDGAKSIQNTNIGNSGSGILQYAAWVVGEYASTLHSRSDTLNLLLLPRNQSLNPEILCAYLQAIPKLLSSIVTEGYGSWSSQKMTSLSLLLARINHFIEPLTVHPNLEVQERAVEFLELMRVEAAAVSGHGQDDFNGPLLLTQALPALFSDFELNPIAISAQKKVPIPEELDLDTPLNSDLEEILRRVDMTIASDRELEESAIFYRERPKKASTPVSAADTLPMVQAHASYQRDAQSLPDPETLERKRAERQERNKDDPFYIPSSDSGATTPMHDILRSTNGDDVDIDAIPIMDLDLGEKSSAAASDAEMAKSKSKRSKNVVVATDETIDSGPQESTFVSVKREGVSTKRNKGKKSLLVVDSSGIDTISLESGAGNAEVSRREIEDAEMAKALAEVERLRLEMQRAQERISVTEGIPEDGALVKKKTRKKKVEMTARQLDPTSTDPSMIDDPPVLAGTTGGQEIKKKKKRKKTVGKTMTEALPVTQDP